MNYNYLKYGTLTFLGFLTLKKNIHFGDYCTGMPDGIFWLFSIFIFIIASIIIVNYNIIKRKSDYRIYIIISMTLALNLLFILLPVDESNNKNIILIGTLDNYERSKQIILKNNKTFIITIQEVEWTCYKKGDYEIKNNILTLKKDNLKQETENLFSYKYKIDFKNKVLIPLEKGFNTIKIK